jgi:hypothetical protein
MVDEHELLLTGNTVVNGVTTVCIGVGAVHVLP